MEEEKKEFGETPKTEKEIEEAAKFEEEVKEHFDKVIAKNEKKMEEKSSEEDAKEQAAEVIAESETEKKKPEKKKKKLKGWQIALIVIGAVIVAAGIGVGLFFLIGELTYKEFKVAQVDLDSARPNVATTFTEAEQNKINLALADNATEDQIKEAIALIYAKANANKIAASNAITIARGEGDATIGMTLPLLGYVEPSGGMIVRGFKVQSGDAYYYQKAAKVSKCSIKAAKDAIEGQLNQQERAYASGTGIFKLVQLKGNAAAVAKKDTPQIPYLAVGDPSSITTCADIDEFKEEGYYLDDQRELLNFRITKDTIVLKELKEGEKYIEYDATKKYYTMRFSLLTEGEGHDECVEVARKYLRDSSSSENLEYGKYDLLFEVWDNGYAKFMHDDEIWQGEIELFGKSTTSSESWYECTFYYDFDESLFTEEDAAKYKGDDWAKKIIDDYSPVFD